MRHITSFVQQRMSAIAHPNELAAGAVGSFAMAINASRVSERSAARWTRSGRARVSSMIFSSILPADDVRRS